MKKLIGILLILISIFSLWYYLLFEGFKAEKILTDSVIASISLSNSKYKYLTFDLVQITTENGEVYYLNADKIIMIKPAGVSKQEDQEKEATD